METIIRSVTEGGAPIMLSVTVIVVTLNRPLYVRECLERLASQIRRPDQVIVVDASTDQQTCVVVAEFPSVEYLRNPRGIGHMTESRNIGLRIASGDIIAFLDDDSFAHPGWLANLLTTYTDSSVGGVGGRALNNQPGEAARGAHEIGQVKANGTLTANFAADPGGIIEVDHFMGCNMSYRREVLAELGGFREDYPGISGLREDTDMCLRVKRLGYRLLFNPAACVDHIGAPQVTGQRFDVRYAFYGARNHMCMLVRNFALADGPVWRYLGLQVGMAGGDFLHRIGAAFARLGAVLLGTGVGLISGIVLLLRTGRGPIRTDGAGWAIAAALRTPQPSTPVPLRGSPHEEFTSSSKGALEETIGG